MGLTYVDLVLANPADASCRAAVQRCMVDTGSELTWVPGKVLRAIGVEPEKERRFVLADRRVVRRRVGFAILELGPYRTIDEVVFGETADLILVGARSLEGFGLAVDPQSHKLRTTPTIAAQNQPRRPKRAPGSRRKERRPVARSGKPGSALRASVPRPPSA